MTTQTSDWRWYFDDVQFGIDVDDARRKLAMTQLQLAETVGFETGNGIGAIERGRADNSISMRKFLKICEVLDLTPAGYFDLAPQQTASEYNERGKKTRS